MKAMRIYFTGRMWIVMAMGFASGLPLALTASTLTAWLADAKIDLSAIGLFAAVAMPYTLKFIWAPVVDGMRMPLLGRLLGRRRGWIAFSQLLLAGLIAAMAFANPEAFPWWTALAALCVAAASATQDIVIDAWRVEVLPKEEYGAGAAMVTLGYRIGMLVSGAGALALADQLGWQATYLAMAAIMLACMLATLLAKEPEPAEPKASEHTAFSLPVFLREHVIAPFADFMTRPNWVAVLAFVALYKLGDAFMGTMFNPFLLDIGFTKTDIATIVKIYGLAATLIGTFIGGALVLRFGMFRTLFVCGFVHMLTNMMLVVQAQLGANHEFLILSIVLENVSGGMSSAAFIAYLSALCRVHYTATQYALLSSLAALGRTLLSTPSGAAAKAMGWEGFFLFASLLALPGLALLWWLEKKKTI